MISHLYLDAEPVILKDKDGVGPHEQSAALAWKTVRPSVRYLVSLRRLGMAN